MVSLMAETQVGTLIKRLREARGLTQGQLATYADVPRSWLSLLEINRFDKPDRDRLERIAAVLHESPETLLAAAGYRVTPLPPRERTPDEIVRELQATLPVRVPDLLPEAEQRASAGPGVPVGPELWYRPEPDARHHQFFKVRVSGDCMEPEIFPGDTVVVDTTAQPADGQTVLVIHEGEALVKIYRSKNGEVWLEALRDVPPIQPNGDTRIIGVVVEIRRRPPRRR